MALNIQDIAFGITDWSQIEETEHAGVTGKAMWRTRHFGNIRVRMVEYAPGYLADHWCSKVIFFSALKANCTPSWKMAGHFS